MNRALPHRLAARYGPPHPARRLRALVFAPGLPGPGDAPAGAETGGDMRGGDMRGGDMRGRDMRGRGDAGGEAPHPAVPHPAVPHPAVPCPAAAARALHAALGALPGIEAHLLAALPAGMAGLRQAPGSVFAALPGQLVASGQLVPSGQPGATALIVPGHDAALGLTGSWHVAEKLAELLAAGRFDLLCVLPGPPAGLEILPIARRALPACRIALILAGPAPDPACRGDEAALAAAGVMAEMARAADLLLRLDGAGPAPGLDPATCEAAADAAACLPLLLGAAHAPAPAPEATGA